MSEHRDTSGRTPLADLPILDELGEDLTRAFLAAEEGATEAGARPRRVWWRRRRGLVLAIATGVAVLLVPAAVATKSLWAPSADSASPDHPRRPTAPVQLDAPRAPRDTWRLSASETTAGLCLHVYLDGAGLTESCSPHVSAAHPLAVQFGGGSRDGYVLGAAVPQARTVTVTVNGQVRDARTFAPDPQRLAFARIPNDFRLFVAFFDASLFSADDLSVAVVARDVQGRVVGRNP